MTCFNPPYIYGKHYCMEQKKTTAWWLIHRVYGGGDSSTEGETQLQRGRFVRQQRGRLIFRGGDLYTEGGTHLQREL
jgi:hypothetical protein